MTSTEIWGTLCAPSTTNKILCFWHNLPISSIGLSSPKTFVICAKDITFVFFVIIFSTFSSFTKWFSSGIYLTKIPNSFSSSNQGSTFDACSAFVIKTSSPAFR